MKINNTDIGFITFIALLITIGIYATIKTRSRNNNKMYTVGKTIKKTPNRFGDEFIYYKYNVSDEEYINSHLLQDKIKMNSLYYVLYSKKNPKNSILLTNRPYRGSLDSIHTNGWHQISE